ncbi:MAG: hypothetical protein J07AB43_06060 [Candidatus Nanosalina sp. J07AB43]|nr:MAG: hypothetical protein J07AB43_06060 [Candidatus Nanosalina sp. J07AB43]
MDKIIIYVALAVLASGCVGSSVSSPEINTGTEEIEITGNSSKQVEIWIENTYAQQAASFQLNITKPEVAAVKDSTGQNISELDMGQAAAGSSTVKKVIIIQGNPEALGSLNSGTDQLNLKVTADTSANLTEKQRFSERNLTVTVKK